MTTKSITERARKTIQDMAAYSSARSLYKTSDGFVFLDANECSYEPYIGGRGLSRYPSQQPDELIGALCRLYDVSSRNLIATRGADEAIDLLIRAFCEPGQDNIVICPPTFPMYAQAAAIQGAVLREVPLRVESCFALDLPAIRSALDENTKIVFLCSPNNPTGTLVPISDIKELCHVCADRSLVVVDETYIEYAGSESCTSLIEKFPNLVVLRTLSKAYAAAGLRCGVAIAGADVIALVRKVLAPYPLPQSVIREVLQILERGNIARLDAKRTETLSRKENVIRRLEALEVVESVFPSRANFLLVKVKDAKDFVQKCLSRKVIVRDQSHQKFLENCIRISIGSEDDMERLFSALTGDEESALAVERERTAHVTRKTKETAIDVQVNLDRKGSVRISTGIGFYDHMLEQIAKHGGFSLQLECKGDLEIDSHHTVEDCAITLGAALKEALGDKRGIERYGYTVPMDEALCEVAIDLSGRFYLSFEGTFPDRVVGDLPTDMVEHVFRSLAENLQATCHMRVSGENSHHMVESCFKAFGRAFGRAIRAEGDDLPSTKGVL